MCKLIHKSKGNLGVSALHILYMTGGSKNKNSLLKLKDDPFFYVMHFQSTFTNLQLRGI